MTSKPKSDNEAAAFIAAFNDIAARLQALPLDAALKLLVDLAAKGTVQTTLNDRLSTNDLTQLKCTLIARYHKQVGRGLRLHAAAEPTEAEPTATHKREEPQNA